MVSFNKYRIWLENDLYLLEISSFAHLKRFEGAFSYQGLPQTRILGLDLQ